MGRNWKEFEGCPSRVDRNEIYVTLSVIGEIVLNRHAFNMITGRSGSFAVRFGYRHDWDQTGEPSGAKLIPLKPKGTATTE